MEKTEFQKIMDVLTKRMELCELHLGNICTTNDLSKLTIDRAATLKNFCLAEEKVMTKICMVDLYHIIGMGDLTPPQMMKFTYAIQKYLKYRPTIKSIAKHLDSILDLPKIPVATQYTLQEFGGITLTSGTGEAVIDTASIEDYEQLKQQQTLLPFRLEGSQIRVDMTQFDYFVSLMTTLFKAPLSADNFRKKITTRGEYIGVEWTAYTGSEAIGQIKSAETFARLNGYCNKHI